MVYQDLVRTVTSCEEKPGTRKSSIEIDTTNPSAALPDHLSSSFPDLTMTNHLTLTTTLLEDVYGHHLGSLIDTVKQIYGVKFASDGRVSGD